MNGFALTSTIVELQHRFFVPGYVAQDSERIALANIEDTHAQNLRDLHQRRQPRDAGLRQDSQLPVSSERWPY